MDSLKSILCSKKISSIVDAEFDLDLSPQKEVKVGRRNSPNQLNVVGQASHGIDVIFKIADARIAYSINAKTQRYQVEKVIFQGRFSNLQAGFSFLYNGEIVRIERLYNKIMSNNYFPNKNYTIIVLSMW